jgi:hypothetical protein
MVFSLVPESALAQVWISSGFQPAPAGPNGQQNITGYCNTSAVNPATGQTSPTAGDYEGFVASCDVTTSTTPAQTITFPQCPYWGWGSYNGLPGDYGNPQGECSYTFPVQPGVTYTINAQHYVKLYAEFATYTGECSAIPSFMAYWCFDDPEGYVITRLFHFVTANTTSSSITQQVNGSPTTSYYPYYPWFAPDDMQGQYSTFIENPVEGVASSSAQYAPLSATITDTSDIMNGNVTVKLTAPAGTTGNLNLDFNGSDASGLELSQTPFTTQTLGSQNLQLPFDTILPGIYPMANGTWDAMIPGASTAQAVNVPDYTLPTPWTYFRKIFYTQYNVPHESSCSGRDEDAWIVSTTVSKGKTTCHFTKIKLNSQFIAAAWMNGTGVDNDGDTLKNAFAVNLGDTQNCAGQYPSGAIGHNTPGGNTFEIVSSITGSCNITLTADQSLAMPCIQTGRQCLAAILSGVQALSCGDQLNLDSGDHTTASTRSVGDLCPMCSKSETFNGADGHIDAFSSSESCTGGAVKNLGYFYTSYPTN